MASPIPYPVDDKDLDDAALWAVIDSAAASHSTSKSRKTLAIKCANHQTPNPSPPPRFSKNPRNHHSGEKDIRFSPQGEVLHEPWIHHRPQKIARTCISELSETSPLSVVKHVQRTPKTPAYSSSSSPETGMFSVTEFSPGSEMNRWQVEDKENVGHSLLGKFPTVSLFKEYQNAAMAVINYVIPFPLVFISIAILLGPLFLVSPFFFLSVKRCVYELPIVFVWWNPNLLLLMWDYKLLKLENLIVRNCSVYWAIGLVQVVF